MESILSREIRVMVRMEELQVMRNTRLTPLIPGYPCKYLFYLKLQILSI